MTGLWRSAAGLGPCRTASRFVTFRSNEEKTETAVSPLTDDVAAAVAAFFHGGQGPKRSSITSVVTGAGYGDDYVYAPNAAGPNKETRVPQAFARARRQPRQGHRLFDGLLSALRHERLLGRADAQHGDDEPRLREALGRCGWYLDDDGAPHAFAGVDVDSGAATRLTNSCHACVRTRVIPRR